MKTRIRDFKFFRALSTISKPITDSTHSISKIAFYVVQLELENGITGQGYLLSFHYSQNAIEGALKDIRAFILNGEYSANETMRVKRDWDIESEYFGVNGLQKWALATVNVAMWDAWGKILNAPIWQILGTGGMKKIPVYGSGGWLSYSDEELLEEVLGYKGRGFNRDYS